MGIEELSMGMSQTKVMNEFSTGVLAMTLDQIDLLGSGMIEMLDRSMMENSVAPHLGGNIDIMV